MKVTIDAPRLGQRLTFQPDSGDDTLRATMLVQPGAFTPSHVHLRQHEYFEVREGELDVDIAGERRCVGPGDAAAIAPGGGPRLPQPLGFSDRGRGDDLAGAAYAQALSDAIRLGP